ncbi:Coenzyme F420 hydrogenase/dehydrogenase, beta subunit C-terminal domain [Lacrimispora sp.]|uniref:Coenzyme F420 hydrogenase/dehydrogenase, beta subunit C-terminal domain n=1 Tax=Lacrimispora sp. TaxID=2719234 RepID=UPI0028A0398B|nr:Coenzyme F420 hydrogenase/dehydrogenase, beta subunit C-terminal domain [Lacrimispora sp.]
MSKIVLFENKKDCCGCSACMNICPKSAISMKTDERGFLYPQIGERICVECGACKTVCAYKIGPEERKEKPYCYAFTNNNSEELGRSSSGGAFSAIMDAIYEFEGEKTIVFGSAIDENFYVVHMSASERKDCDKFCTSKYVQSDLSDCYKQVEGSLRSDKAVLFTGTPCQIAAVRSYISRRKITDNKFYAVDIICHGTPSPGLWKDYVSWMESKYGKMKKFSFRYKAAGWKGYPAMAAFENGKVLINNIYTQVFTTLFFTHKVLRESCYSCQYANLNRPGDLSIGDYWGAEYILQNEISKGMFDPKQGISEILVNTDKGNRLIEEIRISNWCVLSSTDAYIKYQHNLNCPTDRPKETDLLWKEYKKNGADYIIKKYGGLSVKQRIKRSIPQPIKEMLKKTLQRK